MYASRLWWMLRWLGHDRVAVLNGGLKKWLAEERITAPGAETATPQIFTAHPRPGDARHRDRRRRPRAPGGLAPPRRAVTRSVPRRKRNARSGSRAHPRRAQLLFSNKSRRGRDLQDARRSARDSSTDALAGAPPAQTICYCGSGVTACQNLLALEHAGLGGAKLYVGSWSEWSSDPTRPQATGSE